jgi:Esterase-like activity of phytase
MGATTGPDRRWAWLLALGLLPACAGAGAPPAPATPEPAVRVLAVPRETLATADGVPVFLGGLGSALDIDARSGEVRLLTDRGPNVDFRDGKRFLAPGFAPRVGRFQIAGDQLVATGWILLRSRGAAPLRGLPPPSPAGDAEVAYAADGTPLAPDPDGIDPEGLAWLDDGSFWVSEEYGPDLLHFDASGRLLQRLRPGAAHGLPAVLARRRSNRGLEGLTVTSDGRFLVGLMEAPLDNPADAGKKSLVVRVLVVELGTGATRQHVVLREDDSSGFSDILALSPTRFLVLERDKRAPGDAKKPSRIERIERIDLADASDVSDPADGPRGLLFGDRTLEELAPGELRALGVRPAEKTLVVDLLALGYPHDKPEGLAWLDPGHLAVSNDDDFGVDGENGSTVAKRLPMLGGRTDAGELWVIRVPPL